MIRNVKDRSELEKQMQAFAKAGGRVIALPSVEELQERAAEIERGARDGAGRKWVDLGPLARRFEWGRPPGI